MFFHSQKTTKPPISPSITLTTEIGLNIHFIEQIKSVDFGNLQSKGKIYTDLQTYIKDNTFFTSIKLDYFFYIFLFAFLFPALPILIMLIGLLKLLAFRSYSFIFNKIRLP